MEIKIPEPIGNSCFMNHCVWRTQIIPKELLAVRLVYNEKLSTSILRRYTRIGDGIRMSRKLREALFKYCALRNRGLTHDEAFSEISTALPDEILQSKLALDYISRTLDFIVRNSDRIIKLKHRNIPPTGWKILSDNTQVLEPILLDGEHGKLLIRDIIDNFPRSFVGLTFCDDTSCYPAPRGLWPTPLWLLLIRQTGQEDHIFHLYEKVGALTAYEYLVKYEPKEYALVIRPGRKRAVVVIHTYYPKQHIEHLKRLTYLQLYVEKITPKLEALLLNSDEYINGLEILGIKKKLD